ncbi:MAG: hypothetical protein GTO29_04010 [Candidatus Latescibacteria bacterium]|nr:hypothetical protein [Candidatus Latescibacterota bacterium]NIO55241.1 hypothetical protein [Candidatus Latescibacterota bacterium]
MEIDNEELEIEPDYKIKLEEQELYASILAKGMYIGLLVLFITFIVYVSGAVDPCLPMGTLSQYWSMNVADYLQASGCPGGWGWIMMVGRGDLLNFIGIAILAGLTIVCYIAIVPVLIKKKDKIYVVIALLEVLVLCLAASGLISGGH